MRYLTFLGLSSFAGAAIPVGWCNDATRATWPICDTSAALDTRSADIVSRMSVDDKVLALSTVAADLNSISLPGYCWWSEGAHGISRTTIWTGATKWASNTVLPITASCSFNRTLWSATGNQIGREARAFMNVGHAESTYWAPVVNIVRDPRWGRNLESAGEDPFLTGQYASNWVSGFQTAKEVPYPLQATACCKHFVANELDNTDGVNRNHVDSFVPQQDLVDSYLPSFQTCVEEGKVAGIMCRCVCERRRPMRASARARV